MHSETPSAEPESGYRNWKLIVAYDGTDYRGWQVQPGQPTIQGELQAALGRVTGEAPLPQGSGRTDAGVHALAQVASFALRAAIPPDSLKRALNRTLPEAIRVIDAAHAPADFHARHSTIAKTYEYRVFCENLRGEMRRVCPPFLARFAYSYPWPLDLEHLQRAAALFVGVHDFASFAATDPDAAEPDGAPNGLGDLDPEDEFALRKTTIRTIFSSEWRERATDDGLLLIYRVRGNGFLHHMVRNLLGTMLDVGRGYTPADTIPAMIAAKERAAAGPTAPARGLFLHSVEYGERRES